MAWDYVTLGEGDVALLFLHGMAGAYDIWWQVLEGLEDRYRVLALTYPPVDTLEDLAQGILAILAEEHAGSIGLVGSSLGGYLAQYLVARHPERIRAAVFANTFPPNEVIAGKTRLAARFLPLVPQGLLWYVLRQNTERKLYPASGYSEILRAYLLEQYSGAMSKAQFLARYQCVVEAFQPPDPEALGIPVLLLEADNDPLVEKALRDMLKETYPSASAHTLHGVGHFPYMNEPGTYAGLLRGFFGNALP
jgi:pimeloyl-ACP methyl ester carboxylesterase